MLGGCVPCHVYLAINDFFEEDDLENHTPTTLEFTRMERIKDISDLQICKG